MTPEELVLPFAEGGVTAPGGFLAAGIGAGLKKSGKRDLCLLFSERPTTAAAVFTTNQFAAPPVRVSREHVADGSVRAFVVNSGNANACTGPEGLEHAYAMADAAARALEITAEEVVVASTGVIGVPLPIDQVLAGIPVAAEQLDSTSGIAAAEAIMTTDTFPKQTAVTVQAGGKRYTVGGMAKGSGMIEPNMATMLAFVTTDAPLSAAACSAALRSAVGRTFNRITVDSDTSTNDMCMLIANGHAGGDVIETGDDGFSAVAAAIEHVCGELARMIVRDGEGATKFVAVTVKGAESEADADAAARSVANSPLFKTAIFGGDANWGRVVMALGKSSAKVDPPKVEVVFAGIVTCREGTAVPFDEEAAARALAEPEVEVVVDLHLGDGAATIWTCDLSYDYVRINAEYRT